MHREERAITVKVNAADLLSTLVLLPPLPRMRWNDDDRCGAEGASSPLEHCGPWDGPTNRPCPTVHSVPSVPTSLSSTLLTLTIAAVLLIFVRFSPSPMSALPSVAGEEAKDNIAFAADCEYADVHILQEAMAVANAFLRSELYTQALLVSLPALAATADEHPSRVLSHASICLHIHRLLWTADGRQQLGQQVRSIVSRLQARVVSGPTPLLMKSSLTPLVHTITLDARWAAALKNCSFEGANNPALRPIRQSYHTTLLITKFIRDFSRGLTHFLIKLVWAMDLSA